MEFLPYRLAPGPVMLRKCVPVRVLGCWVEGLGGIEASSHSAHTCETPKTTSLPAPTHIRYFGANCKRAVLGIEPRTSRTRSENHATRPNSLLYLVGCTGKLLSAFPVDKMWGVWEIDGAQKELAPPSDCREWSNKADHSVIIDLVATRPTAPAGEGG